MPQLISDLTAFCTLQALLDESEAQLAETQVKLEACHKDNEEMKTRVLRTMADMENLRTRTTNQVAEAKLFAVQGFAKSILEVADNLERAKASVPAEMVSSESTADREVLHKNLDQLRTGVVLTEKVLFTPSHCPVWFHGIPAYRAYVREHNDLTMSLQHVYDAHCAHDPAHFLPVPALQCGLTAVDIQ